MEGFILFGDEYFTQLAQQIKQAIRNIDIIMYDWRWYENEPQEPVQKVNIALVAARYRGVRIRCMVDNDKMAKRLKDLGFDVAVPRHRRKVHAKLFFIDEWLLFCGSHNMTKNASNHNLECSMAVNIQGTPAQDRMVEYYNNLIPR